MLKGAIFDLDGTILDSMFIWDTIGEDYLRSLGKEPKENLKETFKAFTLEQAAKYYRENYGVVLSVNEIVDGVNKMVERYYAETVKLKPGIEVFLEKLKAKGVKMCIATVTDKPLVETALARLDNWRQGHPCSSYHRSPEPAAIRSDRRIASRRPSDCHRI